MQDGLKVLLEELGAAIHESLSDSERVAAAIEQVKRSDPEVQLILEAAISRSGGDIDPGEETGLNSTRPVGKIKFTITQEDDESTP